MAELIWTEPALSDLEAIAEYIALDKPDAAQRLVQRVFAHVERLVDHPNLGSTIPEMRPSLRCRQVVEAPCRVFYRHDKPAKKIYILAVLRGEKLFQKRLLGQRDKRT